jgi:hypothetical protein
MLYSMLRLPYQYVTVMQQECNPKRRSLNAILVRH